MDADESSDPLLERSYAAAQEIAARDANNLYITSEYFVDAEKFRAFCAFYAVMRVVDDRIDSLPSRTRLSVDERRAEHDAVRYWEHVVAELLAGGEGVPGCCPPGYPAASLDLLASFRTSSRRFPHPWELWANFFAAMHRDIDRPRFETYDEFVRYAEGAAVAPTTIYLLLITSRVAGASYRVPAGFDLVECGRQLGLFAYLGHVLRDLAKDLAVGDEGLLYLAADDMARAGVTEASLRRDIERRRASPELRKLVAEIVHRADEHLRDARAGLAGLHDLSPDCDFILELIVRLYRQILDRLSSCSFDPLSGLHEIDPAERWQLIMELKARRRELSLRRHGRTGEVA